VSVKAGGPEAQIYPQFLERRTEGKKTAKSTDISIIGTGLHQGDPVLVPERGRDACVQQGNHQIGATIFEFCDQLLIFHLDPRDKGIVEITLIGESLKEQLRSGILRSGPFTGKSDTIRFSPLEPVSIRCLGWGRIGNSAGILFRRYFGFPKYEQGPHPQ